MKPFHLLPLLLLAPLTGCGDSGDPPVSVATLDIQNAPATMMVGDTATLSAIVRDGDGNELSDRTLTWTTADSGIVTISPAGAIRAVGAGTGILAAATGGIADTVEIGILPVPVLPPAPSNITIFSGPAYNAITLRWKAVPGATSYNLYWSTAPGVTPATGTKLAISSLSALHNGLTEGMTYYYVATTVSPEGESAPSEEVHATASATLAVLFWQPAVGSLSGSTVNVVVQITSFAQLDSVWATVAGRSVRLVFGSNILLDPVRGSRGSGWYGPISLAGLPRGPLPLSLSVKDLNGGETQATAVVMHDDPPTITVTSPQQWSVAHPAIEVLATCTDDDPAGCRSFILGVNGLFEQPLPSGVPTQISLAPRDGRIAELIFTAIDPAGQRSFGTTKVYVDVSPHLTEVIAVPGEIVDLAPDRILYFHGARGELTLRDRSTGAEAAVDGHSALNLAYSFLTGDGAIFALGTPQAVYAWTNGGPTSLGPIDQVSSLAVNGPFAIWSEGTTLRRRESGTGEVTVISTLAGNTASSVAANGDVVYAQANSPRHVFRYRSGVTTQISSDSSVTNVLPLTDGMNVVYLKSPLSGGQYRLAIHDGVSDQDLTPGDTVQRQPGPDYQLANGWTAFTKVGTFVQPQIWSRDPTGQQRQVSSFGSRARIEAIAPDGRIILVAGSRRYLATPPYSTPPTDISSDLGRAIFQGGTAYLWIGRSLFAIAP